MALLRTWLRDLLSRDEKQIPSPTSPRVRGWSESARQVAVDGNDFALAMYSQLRQRPGNLIFSPLSIRMVLALVYAGAKGQTAEEIRGALRFETADETLHATFAEILGHLNSARSDPYEMSVANSLWGQAGAPLETRFVTFAAQHYGAGVRSVDFRRDAESARVAINEWTRERTKGKFPEVVPPNSLEDMHLVAVNTIYFKGKWMVQFSTAATRNEPFYLGGAGGTVQVPLMHQHRTARYVHADDFAAVDLDYLGEDVSMLVLLPDKNDGLANLEDAISTRMLHDCVAGMVECEVELYLPRFKFMQNFDLHQTLATMGMPRAFSWQADFSGINGVSPPHEDALFITTLLHSALVDVNEEGTEAAAATVMFMDTISMALPSPIPVFRADHPFLFAICDRRSQAILFLGRVTDP